MSPPPSSRRRPAARMSSVTPSPPPSFSSASFSPRRSSIDSSVLGLLPNVRNPGQHENSFGQSVRRRCGHSPCELHAYRTPHHPGGPLRLQHLHRRFLETADPP